MIFATANIVSNDYSSIYSSMLDVVYIYMLHLHPIVLGIIYVIFENRFILKFNIDKVLFRICTMIIWIIISVVGAYTLIDLNDSGIIPKAYEEWSGFEYFVYMFILAGGFIITSIVGRVIIGIKNMFKKSVSDDLDSKNIDGKSE